MSNAIARLRRLRPQRPTKRTVGVFGLTAATLAVSVLAFVPASAQEVPQDPPADPVEAPETPPEEPPAGPPADPAPAPETPAPAPVPAPSDGTASTFELPAPDAADPAADYRLRFKECAYDGDADATTCTWQLTDAFGSISAPGGVSHVALNTCLGPDATPTPADEDLILGALRWDVTYDDPDLTLDPNQPPVTGWTWDLSEGQIPVGAELSLTNSGEIPGTGASAYVLQNDDEYRNRAGGPACPTTVSPRGRTTEAGPSTLAAPNDPQTVTIRKQTEPAGDPQQFTFVMQKCNLGSTSDCNANQANWVTVTNGTQAIGDNGVFTWGNDNTAPGTFSYADVRYRVLETTPAGWSFVSIDDCQSSPPNLNAVNMGNQHGSSFRFEDNNGDRFFNCNWNNALPGDATIRIFKGGDRTAVGGTVGTLNGATFNVYDNAGLVGPPVGSCTTGPVPFPAGQCDVTVTADQNYWVAEASSPAPFNVISQLSTTGGVPQNYSFAVTAGQVEEGETALVPPNQSGYQRRFANRRNNPAFPTECGISIALLIDNSNSISAGELTQVKNAALGFSNGLAGTGSDIGVYRFGTSAATLQTPTTNTANVNTAINSISTGGGSTNWDAAFQQVATAAVDVVIIMTDGNPTISNVGGNGSSTTFWDIEEGVASANLVKASGKKVLALGIGSDVSPLNLQAISGPIQGPINGNYDYTIASFEDVEDDLIEIATQLCGAQINVTKLLDGQPANGWSFDPSTPSTATFNPDPGVTAGNGTVQINANPIPQAGTTVTLTENIAAHPGTAFTSASCLKNGQPIGNQGVNAITFPVQRQDVIDCTFNNVTNPGQVVVTKDTNPEGGTGPFPINLTGPNAYNQNGALAQDGSQHTFTPVPAGSGYNLTENLTGLPYTLGGIDCGQGVNPANFTVPAGGVVNCLITNNITTAQFTVNKDFQPNNAANVSVTLVCASGTVSAPNPKNVSEGTPGVWTVTGFVGNPNCTATENPIPAGYTSTGTCQAALQTGSCTIVNVLNTAQFTVNKNFVPDNGASVSVTLTCQSGTVAAPNPKNVSEGTPGVWTVTGFTGNPNCTGTEVIPAGYTASGNPAGTCTAALQTNSCTITNTLNSAQFTVNKDFQPNNGANVSVTLVCASGTVNPAGAQNVSEGTPGVWTVTGFTGNPNCTATENPIPVGYTSTGTCQAALQTGSCTIVNVLNTAQFTVNKDFQPNNGANVSVTLVCASGTVNPAGAQNVSEGTPGVWTVTGFTGNPNCTATENPIPVGYTSTGTCSAALQTGSCTIVNVLNSAQFTVNKDFQPNNGANVSVTLVCASGTVNPAGAQNVSEGTPGVWTVTGFTGNPNCTATENPIPVGYTSTGTCQAALQTGSCTIVNVLNQDTFVVKKDFSDNNPAAVSVTLQCASGTVAPPGAQNVTELVPAQWTVSGYTGNPNCTATENPIPAGYDSTGTCQASLETGECTITNTLRTDTFVVKKDFQPNVGDAVSVTLQCASGTVAPPGAQNVTEAQSAQWTVSGYTGNPSCTATENPIPAGYDSTGTCQASLETGECTITNTLRTDTFVVKKDFSDNNPAAVSVTLQCSSGTVSPEGAQNVTELVPAQWTVSGYTGNPSCTATENPIPAGYDSTGTCQASLETGECTITNTLRTDTFVVKKDFSDNNPAAVSVTLECASGTVSPEGAQNVTELVPAQWTVSGYTGNPSCTATENPIPAGYDSTGTCQASLETGECTITNTLRTDTFVVKKDFSDNNPAAVSVTLECASGTVSPEGAQNVTELVPAQWTVSGYTGNPNCTATENPIPAGYDSTGTCQASLETGECTITNTLNQDNFVVHKVFSDDSTETVSVALECTQGSVTNSPQDASDESVGGTPATFNVQGFNDAGQTTCTATEDIPAGYAGSGNPAGTCQATLTVGECTITNTLLPASISIVKAADPPIVNAGSDVTYTLTVSNDGEVALTNVVVTDALESELTPVSADPSQGSCVLAQTIVCTIGNLAVDQEETIEIVATVADDTPTGTIIENVASVTGDPPVGPPVEDEDDEPVEVTNVSPTTVVPPTSAPGPGPGPGPTPVSRVVSGTLPFTGSMAAMLLKAALWLFGIGALLVFAVRRRRQATA